MGCDEQFTFPPLPVTVTHLPVSRCQICHRTIADGPGKVSEILTDHYRRAHPRSARPPFPVAGHGDPRTARRCRRGHPPARDDLAAGLDPTTPAITQRSQAMITAHTKKRSIRTRRGSLLFVNGTAQITDVLSRHADPHAMLKIAGLPPRRPHLHDMRMDRQLSRSALAGPAVAGVITCAAQRSQLHVHSAGMGSGTPGGFARRGGGPGQVSEGACGGRRVAGRRRCRLRA